MREMKERDSGQLGPSGKRGSALFWTLWGTAVTVAGVFLYFFLVGLADGSVSSFNGILWVLLLSGIGVITGGSYWLWRQGRSGWASTLAACLAVPGLLAVMMLIAILLSDPNWQ
jgi:hypothetical protein